MIFNLLKLLVKIIVILIEKNITYQNQKFTCKILKPNDMKKEIRNLREPGDAGDGFYYAIKELDESFVRVPDSWK